MKLKQKVVPSGKKLDIFVDDEDRANLQAVQVGLLFSRDDCPAPKRTCIVILNADADLDDCWNVLIFYIVVVGICCSEGKCI